MPFPSTTPPASDSSPDPSPDAISDPVEPSSPSLTLTPEQASQFGVDQFQPGDRVTATITFTVGAGADDGSQDGTQITVDSISEAKADDGTGDTAGEMTDEPPAVTAPPSVEPDTYSESKKKATGVGGKKGKSGSVSPKDIGW